MSITSSFPPGILLLLPTVSDSSCSNSFTNQQRLPCSRMPQGKTRLSAAPQPRASLTPRPHRLGRREAAAPRRAIYNPRVSRHLPRPLQDRDWEWLPRVTVGREPCPAPGRWHTPTGFACELLAADSEPLAKFSLQTLPATCQLPPVLSASNTSSASYFRRDRRGGPALPFPGASSPGVRPAPRRCNIPVLPAELWSGNQCDISAQRRDRHRLLSAEQWHSVHPDKFPTVTSVNAVIQANGS